MDLIEILPQEVLYQLLNTIISDILFNILQTNSIFRNLLNEKDIEKFKHNSYIFKIIREKLGWGEHIHFWHEDPRGYRQGLYVKYHHGVRLALEKYRDDKLHGFCQYFYPHGMLKIEGMYEKNYREGIWKYYYINGQLRVICNFRDGYTSGLTKIYYDSGELMVSCNYIDDKEHGPRIDYNPNGTKYRTTIYDHGALIDTIYH